MVPLGRVLDSCGRESLSSLTSRKRLSINHLSSSDTYVIRIRNPATAEWWYEQIADFHTIAPFDGFWYENKKYKRESMCLIVYAS